MCHLLTALKECWKEQRTCGQISFGSLHTISSVLSKPLTLQPMRFKLKVEPTMETKLAELLGVKHTSRWDQGPHSC